MIFSELYSAYYNAVAEILAEAVRGGGSEKDWEQIVLRHAFSESAAAVISSLKKEKWQLLKSDGTTPIRHIPSLPPTLCEKEWLKAISLDPRVQLFDFPFDGLEGVEPLFTPEDYVIYDKYADGDPFTDEGYIRRFRALLRAVRERKPLRIETVNRRGKPAVLDVLPICLEYSEKDDKFRLITSGGTINLARISACRSLPDGPLSLKQRPVRKQTVTLKVFDERNALERCMLHFAHFEKQAERAGSRIYLVRLRYDKDDETEMIIRILSFGPMLEVIEPPAFRELVIERLRQQKSCGLF